ncbi:acylphosphatase [Acinetobacter piscicola]|nr:acylphosphatase [Acinetobacter piscicola]
MKAVRLIIKGRVQGVGYRRWFEKEAIQLNLKGYVRN